MESKSVFKTSNYPRDEKDFLDLENSMATRSMKDRKDLFERQHGRCFWCGKPMFFWEHKDHEDMPYEMVTVDHVYPKGTRVRNRCKENNRPSPVVLSCYYCNCCRNSTPFEIYAKKKGIKLISSWKNLIWKHPELCKVEQ